MSTPSPLEEPIDFKTILTGYDRAFQRLSEARESAIPTSDARLLYIPLLETLTWADVIEEWLTDLFGEDWIDRLPARLHALRDVVAGFRYARNSVHHKWSLAVCLDDEPKVLRDWRWRPTLLVGKKQPKNCAAYKRKIAGRALRHTFRDLHKLYGAASRMVGAG